MEECPDQDAAAGEGVLGLGDLVVGEGTPAVLALEAGHVGVQVFGSGDTARAGAIGAEAAGEGAVADGDLGGFDDRAGQIR